MPQGGKKYAGEEKKELMNQEEKKDNVSDSKRKALPVLISSAVFFMLVMGAGIASSAHLAATGLSKIGTQKISVSGFIIIFAITTLFFMSLVYFLKVKKIKRAIFKILFVLVVYVGSAIFFKIWIGTVPAFIAGICLALAWLMRPKVLVQNFCLTFSMLGVGIFLGYVFSPAAAALLLALFSVYDLLAVYVTKHMIAMAKEMVASGALAAVYIPMKLSGFGEDVNKVAAGAEKFLILGGGDIVFPLFFCVSVARYYGTAGAAITAGFATAGFCASFYQFVSQKTRRPIPALPPIAFFSLIGYAVTAYLIELPGIK